MKNITFKTLQDITKGRLYNAENMMDTCVNSFVQDSRKITYNCAFLCIKGERADGHDYAQQALNNGAALVICDHKIDVTGPMLVVASVLDATQAIAEYYRRSLDIKVVGITGSVGKTSTKEFIASVLSRKYKVHKTQGNHNNQWGVPFTIFEIDETDEVAVLEMGISDMGEMDELARMARPNVAVITNIGESHLEFFKTREGILKAKAEIFNYLGANDSIVINGDDDKLSTVVSARGIKPVFFGLGSQCNVSAERIVDKGLDGSEFDIVIRDGGGKMSLRVSLPVPGMPNIYNALAATAVGMKLGVSLMEIKSALQNMKGAEGRNNIVKTEKFMILDDCYNAAPKSVESSIDLLNKMPGRKVAILGDMLELGEHSDKMHFRVGKYAAKANIDVIVCVGNASEKTYMGAKMCTDNQVELYRNTAECIENLKNFVKEGDSILVKASNAMKFSAIVDALKKM